MTRPGPNQPCPCRGGAKYKRCCGPWHKGRPVPSPEALMRSRFAAYACGMVEYVLETTDPEGPQAQRDVAAWQQEVAAFCAATAFEGLEVLDAGEDGDEGWVEFRAALRQDDHDASFTERSRFVRRDGRWLYHSGDLTS